MYFYRLKFGGGGTLTFDSGSIYTRSDPNGSVLKLQRISLAFTRELTDPNTFVSAIRTRAVSLSKVIPLLGSDPKKSLV